MPTTMFWNGASTPTIAIPDCSDCMISAPRMAPWIVPRPPDSAVPPMTAAAMTRSSSSVPMSLV